MRRRILLLFRPLLPLLLLLLRILSVSVGVVFRILRRRRRRGGFIFGQGERVCPPSGDVSRDRDAGPSSFVVRRSSSFVVYSHTPRARQVRGQVRVRVDPAAGRARVFWFQPAR